MNELILSEIWIYPVKSLGGIRLDSSLVTRKGLKYDRRFMLVDESLSAITQRKVPLLALFKVSMGDTSITISFGEDRITLPMQPESFEKPLRVTIWNDIVEANEVAHDISMWFSDHLKKTCKLIFFPEPNDRPVDAAFREDEADHVSLADAFPILMIGQESLNDLNSKLEMPVPMNRFRPNLVFTGGTPFIEDTFSIFTIGNNTFKAVKPCSRCILTTIDQATAAMGPEPLRTLARYRKTNNKVLFGQNVLIIRATEIKIGERIFIESYR